MATEPSALFQITSTGSGAIHSDSEIPADVQSFVKAAMASVEDQLADLASTIEAVTRDRDIDSEVSSTASPMIGAASDIGSNKSGSLPGRPRSSSLSSLLNIAVDYDAIAAAVDAAEAAAGAIDLTNFAQKPEDPDGASSTKSGVASSGKNRKKRPLPLQKARKDSKQSAQQSKKESNRSPKKQYKKPPASMLKKPPLEFPPIPQSTLDERDLEKIRERARAAAGYVPPSSSGQGNASLPPPKKRAKLYEASTVPMTPATAVRPPTVIGSHSKTPLVSNTTASRQSAASCTPYAVQSSTPSSQSASRGQSSQKWEQMFECLVKFIEDQKKDETKAMTDAQKKDWVWDGNVPTTYKTKDGKALGRWVNNQRSAKSKGTLKEEREVRLVNAGLKWSVLASNSWNEMLEELRIYIEDQAKQGKKWDGNGKRLLM
jgi:hypothetical protein